MSTVDVIYALAFHAAVLTLVVGLFRKVRQYHRTPSPLRIPTMPAPMTRAGVVRRMIREVLLFESLFKASPWTWLFGWAFHAGLALVAVRHLRYFTEPVWGWVAWMQPFGIYAGFAMMVGLTGLLIRRLAVDRVRYISAPSDFLMLALLLGIGGSGVALKYVAHTDIVATKVFFLGLVRLSWQPLPADSMLLIHLTLVVVLMVVFPFSKLLHAPGVFFSPTRNQADTARSRRHVTPWVGASAQGRKING